jgi:hypothetical protein
LINNINYEAIHLVLILEIHPVHRANKSDYVEGLKILYLPRSTVNYDSENHHEAAAYEISRIIIGDNNILSNKPLQFHVNPEVSLGLRVLIMVI